MVAIPGSRSSSCNAGELSPLLAGRPDIKQYYSGGLAFKNFEPVPQSGFRLMPGSFYAGEVRGTVRPVAAANDIGADFAFNAAPIIGAVLTARAERFCQTVLEAESGGEWRQIGAAFELAPQNKVFHRALPAGASFACGHLRLRPLGNGGAISVSHIEALASAPAKMPPRYCPLKVDQENSFMFSFQPQSCDIFKNGEFCGFLWLKELTEAILPDLDFYAEAATVGLFHQDLQTLRLRRAGNDADWAIDLWPYENVPEVDYGLNYEKREDQWAIDFRAVGNNFPAFTMRITVNSENTSANFNGDWGAFANDAAAAVNALPSIEGGVHGWAYGGRHTIWLGFGGKSLGQEFQVSCMVTSTSEISALPSHTQIGRTGGEAIISQARGWPATCGLMQDRIAYAGMKGQPAAQLLSQTGEYFNLNIKAAGDNAARLDRLRTQTAERIFQVKESKYFIIFTNEGAYYATNRVISHNEPLNYVNTCEIGIRKNTKPIDMEGLVYYVSNNGKELLSMAYDDIATSYTANIESLLATHLIEGINRSVRQVGATATDTSRIWLMRADGRLICSNVIRNQEIIGFSEWVCADNGSVREIAADGANALWLCVERRGRLCHSIMEQELLFQESVKKRQNVKGIVDNLPFPDGAQLWAEADGYVLGPFSVQQGAINLGKAFQSAIIGRWQQPFYESMPHVKLLPNEQILRRPGRIHTAYINIIDTSSLAVGANGLPPRDVPLVSVNDRTDEPPAAKSELKTIGFLLGQKIDTTLTISQMRPGRLQVRDYATGEAL